MTNDQKYIWPEKVRLRDTRLHDDLGGLGQRIYTTAGAGYEKREYVRADALEAKDAEIERLDGDNYMQAGIIAELQAENAKLRVVEKTLRAELIVQYVEEYGDTENEAAKAINDLIAAAAYEDETENDKPNPPLVPGVEF